MEKTETFGQLAEIQKALEHANDGNWIPIGVIAGVFSVIILLLLYIWNQNIKNNNARHEKTEELLSKTSDTLAGVEKILAKHEIKLEHLQKTES